MRVEVTEHGSRPAILTRARMNAPAAAKVLADMMFESEFADYALLVIDWAGDFGMSDDMPNDIKKPVLRLIASKFYPEIQRFANIDFVVDMEDAFSQDNFGHDAAVEIVQHLRTEFEKKNEEARALEGRA